MKNFIALLLLFGGMLLFNTAKAQGTFTFTNNTSQNVNVAVMSIYDDCVTNPCWDGPVMIGPGNSHNFTGCAGSGAWKEIRVWDACDSRQVGICIVGSTTAAINLCSGTAVITYTDEHTGDVQ